MRRRCAAPGAPAEKVPPGQLLVVVSIARQNVSLYADGKLVRQSPVSTGTRSHPTPMGVFSVIQKNRHHVSNLYFAKMPYMQRLTWSGTALHEGPLPGYPASHGCVRLPREFASMLWGATRIGARVIVTRDDATPSEIAHAALFAPRAGEPMAAARVKTADATGSIGSDAAGTQTVGSRTAAEEPAPLARDSARRRSPVSVFVSRKDGRLYVRHGMEPLFDAPVTIRDPEQATGTHVFTAMDLQDDGAAMRWSVVSIPSAYPREPKNTGERRPAKPQHSKAVKAAAAEPLPASLPSAASVLDRIEMPQDARERIAALLVPGSSLIVSDNGISPETGRHTDFIVLTR
jgi:hypothetical protein